MFGSQLVNDLGRIKRYGLVRGGVALAVDFEVSKTHAMLPTMTEMNQSSETGS